jgi:L-lactate dehydrogenase complex protein LldG
MSSREKILSALNASKPEYLPLATWVWDGQSSNVTETFIKTLESIGGSVSVIKDVNSIKQILLKLHPDSYRDQKRIVNKVAALHWNDIDHNLARETAIELETIEVAILEGKVGVAENGAIWIDELAMGHRALPFICQHLILVLSIKKIVSNMHEAYSKIDVTEHGFGTFIAGPSKTADIEQALVIGAHGARSLRVFLVEQG